MTRDDHGPFVWVREPGHAPAQQHALRRHVSRHDDIAWVNARPSAGRTPLPTLVKDLLDASGIVGLRPPRRNGQAHSLPLLPHWLHGPVRHVVINDAHFVDPESLDDVIATALVSGVTVWALTLGLAPKPAWTTWAGPRCGGQPLALLDALRVWGRHQVPDGLCQPPGATWWQHTDWWEPLTPCTRHDERSRCVLSWIRRGTGTPTPNHARALLSRLLEHPASTVEDHWALRDASRDTLTPAVDVVVAAGVRAGHRDLVIEDAAEDGSWIRDAAAGPGQRAQVRPRMQPALRRHRSAQLWGGCSPRTPLLGLDGEPAWIG
jgi:hypothetical protein